MSYFSKPMPLISQGQAAIPAKYVYHGELTSDCPDGVAATVSAVGTVNGKANAVTIPSIPSFNLTTYADFLADTAGEIEFKDVDIVAVRESGSGKDALYYAGADDETDLVLYPISGESFISASDSIVVSLALIVYYGLQVATGLDEATGNLAMNYPRLNKSFAPIIGVFTKEDYPRQISNLITYNNLVATFYKVARGQYLKNIELTLQINGFTPATLLPVTGFIFNPGDGAYSVPTIPETDYTKYAHFITIDKGEKQVLDKLILIYSKKSANEAGVEVLVDNAAITLFTLSTGEAQTKVLLPYYNEAVYRMFDEYIAFCVNLPKEAAKQVDLNMALGGVDYFNSATLTFTDSANLETGRTKIAYSAKTWGA